MTRRTPFPRALVLRALAPLRLCGVVGTLAIPASVATGQSVTGCLSAAGTQRSMIRDSAGIRIAENHLLPSDHVPHLELAVDPILVIGTDSADPQTRFHQVMLGALRLPDGTVLVVDDWPDTRIRMYDRDGRFIRNFATLANGATPAHSSVVRIWSLPGDTIVVTDLPRRSASFFTRSGERVRNLPLPGGGAVQPVGVTNGGGVIGTITRAEAMSGRTFMQYRDTSFAYSLRPTGGLWESERGPLPGATHVRGADVNGVFYAAPPFTPNRALTVGPSGYWHGNGIEYDIRHHLPNGSVNLILRLCRPPTPVSRQQIERWRDSVINVSKTPGGRAARTRYLDQVSYPDYWTSHRELHVDKAGRLWVREPAHAGDFEWYVYSRDGRLEATATLKLQTIFEIGYDYVLTAGAGPDGSLNVQVLGLVIR